MTDSKIELGLVQEAIASGFQEGTEAFKHKVIELRVHKCRDLNKVPFCSVCPIYMDCSLVKEHLRNVAFGGSDGNGGDQ